MDSSSEELIQWDVEAQAVIKDVKAHVQDIQLSEIPSTLTGVYFNITTIENKQYCVHLGPRGFRVVGVKYNETSNNDLNRDFETPYALLSAISSQYSKSFGDLLMEKLCPLLDDSNSNG